MGMKWFFIIIGVLVAVPLVFFSGIYTASELGGEVVVLHRNSSNEPLDRVRIWIVEDTTGTWVEHGGADATWIARLKADPSVTIERNGAPATYQGQADPHAHDRYHQLRREKYGFADEVVEMASGGHDACDGIPVRLETL
jgi:hypothetical protein